MSTKNRHRTSVLRSASRRASAPSSSASAKRTATHRRGALSLVAPLPAQDSLPAATVELLCRVAIASSSLAVGFEVTARSTRRDTFAEEATWLASLHRSLAEEIAVTVGASGATPPRTKPTCGERLRWEWLASAGRLMDGVPEVRLLAECARIQVEADRPSAALLGDTGARAVPGMRRMLAALQRVQTAAARIALG